MIGSYGATLVSATWGATPVWLNSIRWEIARSSVGRGAAEIRCILDVRSCRQSPVYHDFVFWLSRQRGRQGVRLSLPLQRHSFVVGFGRGGVGQDGVKLFGIVKRYPSGDDPLGLEAI